MIARHPEVLLLDADRVFAREVAAMLARDGHLVQRTANLAEAEAILAASAVRLLIVDSETLGSRSAAIDSITRLLHRASPPAVLVMTAHGSVAEATALLRTGVADYLVKPIAEAALRASVTRCLDRQQLFAESNGNAGTSPGELIGSDATMGELFRMVDTVAAARSTLLIVGESGTGKSMLARAIHRRSPRRAKPFVELSCGGLPETLLESELFGHVRGAFTGAITDKQGRFAAADGGTIFLDEINSASPLMQVKLLRVLQEHAFEPVGSNQTRTVDARTILATNADLGDLVASGSFRQDLFYRVNVITLRLPPLRERIGDVPLLANHFLEKFRLQNSRQVLGFTDAALNAMLAYAWPGNVRELENAVERATLLCDGARIDVDDLPEATRTANPAISTVDPGVIGGSPSEYALAPTTLEAALLAPERQIIEAALARNGWCRVETARELAIDRTTLYKKMRKHRLGAREVA